MGNAFHAEDRPVNGRLTSSVQQLVPPTNTRHRSKLLSDHFYTLTANNYPFTILGHTLMVTFKPARYLLFIIVSLANFTTISAQTAGKPVATSSRSLWESTQSMLLKDLKQVASPGLPGVIAAINDQSFVIIAGKDGSTLAPVIAAGEMPGSRKGRIAAFGHDGYLDPAAFQQHDTGKLCQRLARWAAGKPEAAKARSKPGRLGLINRGGLEPFFTADGWVVSQLSGDWTKQISGLDVVVVTAGDIRTKQQAESLRAFLNRGGGVLFGITGWGWEQVSGGKSLVNDFPLTPVLAQAGLAVTNATADATAEKAMAVKPLSDLKLTHAGDALKRLSLAINRQPALDPNESAQLGASLLLASRSISQDESTFRKPLMKLIETHPRRQFNAKNPVDKSDVLDRLAIQIDFEIGKSSGASSITANPNAAFFPGTVAPNTPKVTKTIEFAAGNKGRMGTGLYAAPGTVIEVKSVKGDLPGGTRLRIGAHSDTTWHLNRWERHPEISRVWGFEKNSSSLQAGNAFGGLVYLEVNQPLTADVHLQIKGAVEAPHYVLGQTDLKAWSQIRKSGAPWAELQSKHVGLILPSTSVRDLDDPKPLMELWDRIMQTQEELGAINPPYRPIQWIVPDQQISAGYMHSGNPIMTFLDVVPWFSRVDKVLASDPGGVSWGILHEIGHNRQHGEWTPGGLGEVTNNLFALYVYDKMLGKPSFGHPGLLVGDKRNKALAKYRASGPNFNQFKSDPFLALAFFMDLQEAFGWEPLSKFFAEVEKMPANQQPRTDEARWDNWLVGMSQQTNKNLGPFFQLWGIPVSNKALEEVKKFAAWKRTESQQLTLLSK